MLDAAASIQNTSRLFELGNEFVDPRQEDLATRRQWIRDHFRRTLSQFLMSGHARPAANFAIRKQREAADIPASARKPQITEEIVEAEL